MAPKSFEIVCSQRDVVGESPFWDHSSQTLYWVDIVAKKIFFTKPSEGKVKQFATEDFPTAIALVNKSHKLIVSFATGVCLFDLASGSIRKLVMPDEMAGNRLNEGKCDQRGRFWTSSMQTNLNPDGSERPLDRNSGALFRIDADYSASCHSDHEFGISNTMAWSADRRTFYFGDSIRNVIFAYDFDDETGSLAKRRVLLQDYDTGVPDGSCLDDDDCLWNSRFGGAQLIRISPKGRIDQKINLPVTNPTSCVFGGPDLKTLFVTSARFKLSKSQLEANRNEGALLGLDLGYSGPASDKFIPHLPLDGLYFQRPRATKGILKSP